MGRAKTSKYIEQRKAKGIVMNRLNCGWNLPTEVLADIALTINEWEPQTDVDRRDKHICELAFIHNMNASQIERLNDPLIVGMGNRSMGQPLSAQSILQICYKHFPMSAIRTPKKQRHSDQRNELAKARQHGSINKPKVCCTCGGTNTLELHHIIPIAMGGTNDYFNLVYLCHDCHMRLHHEIMDCLKIPCSNNIE